MAQLILPSTIQRNLDCPAKIIIPAKNYQEFEAYIYQHEKKLHSFLFKDKQQLQPYIRLLIGETFFDANYGEPLKDKSIIEVLMPMSGG